jgi:alpha-ketoglutarate-dependent taurine dioxygenase
MSNSVSAPVSGVEQLPGSDVTAIEALHPEKDLGAIIRPAGKDQNLIEFAGKNRELVDSVLMKRGAILFRGFDIRQTNEFEDFIRTVSGGALEYKERTSPRTRVSGNIYTSTDYPPNQSIFPHNENSYSLTFPRKLFFFCMIPAQKGGETPIIDTRKVFQRVDPEIKKRFLEKGWMYVRNFGKGFGLAWQTVFQTEDREAVEEYCREGRINFEWKKDNCLKTWQVRPCVARHPKTGEPVWFNHATFFHVTTLPAAIRDFLQAEFGDGELPNNTYYGDGAPIEPEVLEHLRGMYHEETIKFPWQRGDVMLVDNLMAGHAREPFVGPRKIVVGMAEPTSWDEVLWTSPVA